MSLPSSPPAGPRLVHAAVCGIALFQLLVVTVNGYLAALPLPAAYFAWFGRTRLELALFTLQTCTALVVVVLVAGGVLATARLLRSRSWPFLASVLAGMLLCSLYGAVVALLLLQGASPMPLSERLQAWITWWALPGMAAPWLGFAWAAWLLRRRAWTASQRPDVRHTSP